MTIKSSKNYDQHAHDQPTQASAWAADNAPDSGGMGADTRKLMASAAAGEAPWHHSYSATNARRADNADPAYPHYGSQDASIRRGYQPGNEAHNVALSRQHMAMNQPGASPSGGLRPKRLTGEEMDQISPGWTDRMYERAQRSDGGNDR